MKNTSILVPKEIIESKIYLIRGKKVMLDNDLARLYQVETKALKRAVRRNKDRFPEDFMFQLNEKETKILRYQFGTLEMGKYSKYFPFVFTEQGVAMLSSVLNSKKAIRVNIQIIRTFVRIREMIISNKELRLKIEKLEKKCDDNFRAISKVINRFLREEPRKENKIGFEVNK